MDNRIGMSLLLLSFLPLVLSANNHTTASYQISRKPCQVKGKEGTCMFVWECVKTEGTPLGMCMERFMFGSCCAHDVDNNVVPKQPTVTTTVSSTTTESSGLTLAALITSRPLSITNTTTAVGLVTSDETIGSDQKTITSQQNVSTTTSTTSPTHSTVTLSTTTSRIPGSQASTLGSIKLRPYRRTTTRRAAIPTTTPTNLPDSSSTVMTSALTALITDAPQLIISTTTDASLTVPIATESMNSATLTSPIDLSNTLTYFNELNTTDEMPDTIPTATNQPFYDVTTGSEDTTTEMMSTTTEQTTTVTPMTTSESVMSTTSPPTTTTVRNVTTTIQPSPKPPILIVTLTNNKNNNNNNTSTTETTKKPVLAVTSLPSSYPDVECGVPPLLNRHQEGRIVGGSNSKFGSWPWQVSVRRTSFFGFSSTHRCGGALLNELWVITAGHCVEDLLVSQIRLRMGEFDFSSVQEPYPFVERGVNKKIVHPKYNFFTYEYDLALVRLEEPITFQPNIAPICLPATDESLIGQNGTVTGWGRLSEGGTLPSMLQQVTVPIVSNDKCKDMFLKAGRHEYIPDIFMCAGFEEGGRDSCQGDSGGPLQIRGRDGRYFLGGIISWGIGCAEANLPGVCTRISKFTSWILENVT